VAVALTTPVAERDRKVPLVEASGLEHAFGNDIVLEKIDLALMRGEILALLGPSGCGKTTLLRLLSGLLTPSGGRLERTRAAREAGFVFQRPVLLPWRNALDNVLLPVELHGRVRREDRERARELLSLVGLAGFERHRPAALSGGMQQRVALARSLIERPRVLFLDEPFSSLDEITREEMNLELLRIFEAAKDLEAAVLVTHSLEEAAFLADRIAVMGGRPGVVLALVDISLARPRRLEHKDSEEYTSCTARLRQLVRSAAGLRSS
jgi:NitT/TauT family transport system ATP-binding protein